MHVQRELLDSSLCKNALRWLFGGNWCYAHKAVKMNKYICLHLKDFTIISIHLFVEPDRYDKPEL